MDALRMNQEVVHEGWLIKSPPTKLWKARWRQRWFTLRHSGELPGQYFLEYYTDKKCRKLKGKIDLDQCEQVDAGLSFENRKDFMFNVKTPKRIYYLVAESENDMNKWVDAICQVCGLKAYTQDENQYSQMFPFESQESPPISPSSSLSSPYIPISECISGPRLTDVSSLHSFSALNNLEGYNAAKKHVPSPPRSPTTDPESLPTDDESSLSLPNVNWDTFPSAGDLKPNYKASWSAKKRFGKMKNVEVNKSAASIPPRPPKPSPRLVESPSHNYLNLDGATESSKPTTPSTPAPSSTPTDSLNNTVVASKSRQAVIKADVNKLQKQKNIRKISNTSDHVFRYDFEGNYNGNLEKSITNTNHSTSTDKNKNKPVPIIIVPPPPPPLVDRGLKPGRKASNSSYEFNPTASNAEPPPSIDRKLKPHLGKSLDKDMPQLASPPNKGKTKHIPSPIMITRMQRGRQASMSDDDNVFEEKEEIFFYKDNENFVPSNRNLLVLQYLDLDLDKSDNISNSSISISQSSLATTVYKTVDFVKTEAFNRTRQRVEEERKQCNDELT